MSDFKKVEDKVLEILTKLIDYKREEYPLEMRVQNILGHLTNAECLKYQEQLSRSSTDELKKHIQLCIREFEVYSNHVGDVITEYHWRGANECILLLENLMLAVEALQTENFEFQKNYAYLLEIYNENREARELEIEKSILQARINELERK